MANGFVVHRGTDEFRNAELTPITAVCETGTEQEALQAVTRFELDHEKNEWWVIFDKTLGRAIYDSHNPRWHVVALNNRDPVRVSMSSGENQQGLDKARIFCEGRRDFLAWRVLENGRIVAESDPSLNEVLNEA